MPRFIFITGGVVSSLGKGIAASSIASLLQARGYKVLLRKLDPYLNVDPGTMSPTQHGEVFVTNDGAETDLDLGHYERFTGVDTQKTDSTTTGKIYSNVIEKERRGDYLGATIQVIPHIIDEIKKFIFFNIEDTDFIICEIGGTVGDIEGLPYLEAIRQVSHDVGRSNVLYIHLTLIPYLSTAKEIKTKPTQHSVKELLNSGIQPDILLCRTQHQIPYEAREKIALFCNVLTENVIAALDMKNIYEIPLSYHEEGLDKQICIYFKLPQEPLPKLDKWINIKESIENSTETVNIAIVGKYIQLQDAYKSLIEAIYHAGFTNSIKPCIKWVDGLAELNDPEFNDIDAVLIPGGFGSKGVEGKLHAIKYARENKVPFLGICFGMQLSVIEAMRNLANIKEASSTEFGHTNVPVVGLMTEWLDGDVIQQRKHDTDLGGTMRLGSYPCKIQADSLAYKLYGKELIHERHRHRYEVNINYQEILKKHNLNIVGISPDGKLPEIVEYKDHPWFIAVQYHPELKSRPFDAHPLFVGLIKAALDYKKNKHNLFNKEL